jgi:hypothetical protein
MVSRDRHVDGHMTGSDLMAESTRSRKCAAQDHATDIHTGEYRTAQRAVAMRSFMLF